jgi:hypothetical protein
LHHREQEKAKWGLQGPSKEKAEHRERCGEGDKDGRNEYLYIDNSWGCEME